jgi:heptosyltransferase I
VDHERQVKVNILIVKLSAIGDVIHTLPALAGVRRLYPEAHITWIVEEAASDILKGHPHIDRLIVSGRKRWMKDIGQGSFRGPGSEIRSMIRTLRDRPYDLAIDFHGLFKSAVFVLLSGAKRKLGYDSLQEASGLFLNEKIPEDMNMHAVDRYLDFVRYLGLKDPQPEFLIPATEDNERRIDALLEENGIRGDDRFISISPVALWDTKLWEVDRFASLADRIAGELGYKVVLTGADDKTTGSISSLMREQAADLGGKTGIRDLACLYRRARLLVSTDSGPMHLAAAVKTPVVALFGPTDPGRTGPYGEGHTVIMKNLSCQPCFLKKCDTKVCMREISVNDVFRAVEEKVYGR